MFSELRWISASDLAARLRRGDAIDVIDVRERGASPPLPGTLNIPLSELRRTVVDVSAAKREAAQSGAAPGATVGHAHLWQRFGYAAGARRAAVVYATTPGESEEGASLLWALEVPDLSCTAGDPSPWLSAFPAPAEPARRGSVGAVTMMTTTSAVDVLSLDGILTALYESISGPAGPRDWFRLRNLFWQGAILGGVRPLDGERMALDAKSVDAFIEYSDATLRAYDYHEREIARRVERFGHVAHVLSTYESRLGADPRATRGINSFQLFWDGARWWIASMVWDTERAGAPLPDTYLESTRPSRG
jgi:hypothetical protein